MSEKPDGEREQSEKQTRSLDLSVSKDRHASSAAQFNWADAESTDESESSTSGESQFEWAAARTDDSDETAGAASEVTVPDPDDAQSISDTASGTDLADYEGDLEVGADADLDSSGPETMPDQRDVRAPQRVPATTPTSGSGTDDTDVPEAPTLVDSRQGRPGPLTAAGQPGPTRADSTKEISWPDTPAGVSGLESDALSGVHIDQIRSLVDHLGNLYYAEDERAAEGPSDWDADIVAVTGVTGPGMPVEINGEEYFGNRHGDIQSFRDRCVLTIKRYPVDGPTGHGNFAVGECYAVTQTTVEQFRDQVRSGSRPRTDRKPAVFGDESGDGMRGSYFAARPVAHLDIATEDIEEGTRFELLID